MGVVAVLCPKTGLQISTGLAFDQAAFDAMHLTTREVDCWACGGRHFWSRRWATLIECDDPDVLRPGMPMPRSRSLSPA
jgi:hypothetical protein